MNKCKTCREILLLSCEDNDISDEEFVPLYGCYRSKNPDFGYQSYDVFDLENMNSADCKAEFRVEKADLPRLKDSLQMDFIQTVDYRFPSQSTSGTSFLCSKNISC